MDRSKTPAFPIEEVARIPAPGFSCPASLAFSPDDRLLTFLYSPDATLVNQLFAFDPQTGQRTLLVTPGDLNGAEDQFSLAEALRRERLRQLTLGVTQYAWAADSSAMLIPLQGSLYGKTGPQQPLFKILDGKQDGPILAPQLSPDGRRVAFVKEDELYAAPLAGGALRQITTEPGMHSVVLDHACQRFIDTCSSISHPPQVNLRSLAGGAVLQNIHTSSDPRLQTVPLIPPEIVRLHNRHGDVLYGAIYRPASNFGKGPFPTVVYVYGGPHVQLVCDDWKLTAAMRPQYLSSLGFLVFVLDNRGSSRRSLADRIFMEENIRDFLIGNL